MAEIVATEIKLIFNKKESILEEKENDSDTYVLVKTDEKGKRYLLDKRELIDDDFEAMLRMATEFLPFERSDLQAMPYKLYFKNVVKAIERQKQHAQRNEDLKNKNK